MTLIAGVDIGNSTTEVVIADTSSFPPQPCAWDRVPTHGLKGSPEATRRAARVVQRLARRSGFIPDLVAMTAQQPVLTGVHSLPRVQRAPGRLVILDDHPMTPAGSGVACGRPIAQRAEPPRGIAVILVASDPLSYRATADTINRWRSNGIDLRGALLAGDEARLVHARIGADLVIVDRVNSEQALRCDLIALEVNDYVIGPIADPLYLVAHLDLLPDEISDATIVAGAVRGSRCAVIGRLPIAVSRELHPAGFLTFTDGFVAGLDEAHDQLAARPVGSAAHLVFANGAHQDVSDAWVVDIQSLGSPAALRRASTTPELAVSTLATVGDATVAELAFQEVNSLPILIVGDEARAAALGARTTPGCAENTVVLDLGGGTIDIITDGSVTGAGSGDLLSACIGSLAGISLGAAEWVKQGPAFRIDTPSIASRETQTQDFLPTEVPGSLVGWLAVNGPTGALPFSRNLTLGDWRQLRLAAKRAVIEDNVRRISGGLQIDSPTAVAVGGPVGDREILECLSSALPALAIGRGDVAGTLGHRFAVAYGLVLLAAQEMQRT